MNCIVCGVQLDGESVLWGSGRTYCQECFDDTFSYCQRCDSLLENNLLLYDYENDSRYCRECYDHINRNRFILPYNYIPIFIQHSDTSEKSKGFIGIELEIECKENVLECAKKVDKYLKDKDMKELFYIKHDGSLNNGFEIVSQPMTYRFIKKNINFKEFLEFLSTFSSSFKEGTCGLHFHYNINDISTEQSDKIRTFFTYNKDLLFKFSQRQKQQLDRYARFENFSLTDYNFNKKNNGKSFYRYPYPNTKYVALRFPECKPTMEFRIFRGTLDYNRFLVSMQFVDAIVNYVKSSSIASIVSRDSWEKFINFARETKRYNALVEYSDSMIKKIKRQNKREIKKKIKFIDVENTNEPNTVQSIEDLTISSLRTIYQDLVPSNYTVQF